MPFPARTFLTLSGATEAIYLLSYYLDPSRPLEGEVVLRAHYRTCRHFVVLLTALKRL